MVKLFCTKCGNQLSDDAKFCGKCGNNLSGEESNSESQGSVKVVKEPKEKKEISFKMPKQKLGIIAIAIVLILALGFIAKDFLVYAITPEKYVLASLNKTFKTVGKDFNNMQSMFFGKIKPDSSNTNNIKFMVKNINHTDPWVNEDMYMLNGMGFELTTAMDRGNKAFFLNGKTIYNGRDFLSFNAKLDDEEIAVNIPELYHKSFMVPSKDFGRQWNMSTIARENYLYVNDSLDLSYSELMKDTVPEKMDDRTRKAYLNGFNTMIKNASFEKAGSEHLLIGDKSKKVNKTKVVLNSNDVKNGLLDLIDALRNDNRMEQWKDTLRSTNQSYVAQEFEEALNDMRYGINEYFEADRIIFHIYTVNGKVVQMDLNLIPDMDYKEDNLNATLGFLGDKNLIDEIKFEFVVGEDEEARLIFNSKGNHTGSKNSYTDDTRFILYEYGTEFMRLNSKTEIDLSKGKDNLKFNLDIVSEDANVTLNTKGDFNTSSKKIEYNLYDIFFTMKDYYQDSFLFEGSLSFSWEDGVKGVSDPSDTEKLRLLELTEYDIYEIMSILEENIYYLGNSLGL